MDTFAVYDHKSVCCSKNCIGLYTVCTGHTRKERCDGSVYIMIRKCVHLHAKRFATNTTDKISSNVIWFDWICVRFVKASFRIIAAFIYKVEQENVIILTKKKNAWLIVNCVHCRRFTVFIANGGHFIKCDVDRVTDARVHITDANAELHTHTRTSAVRIYLQFEFSSLTFCRTCRQTIN